MPSVDMSTRRAVSGLAFKECEFCGREHQSRDGKTRFNYQYFNNDTNEWDKQIFCSKTCRNAWRTINDI